MGKSVPRAYSLQRPEFLSAHVPMTPRGENGIESDFSPRGAATCLAGDRADMFCSGWCRPRRGKSVAIVGGVCY